MGIEEERNTRSCGLISLYEGAKTRVSVNSESSQEFEVKIGMYKGSMLSPFLISVVVDVIAEFARVGALGELLYVDDLVLMSETIEELRNKFIEWKVAFDSKGLKVCIGKTKAMVCGGMYAAASQRMACLKVR